MGAAKRKEKKKKVGSDRMGGVFMKLAVDCADVAPPRDTCWVRTYIR